MQERVLKIKEYLNHVEEKHNQAVMSKEEVGKTLDNKVKLVKIILTRCHETEKNKQELLNDIVKKNKDHNEKIEL